jgi:hypothetical protein
MNTKLKLQAETLSLGVFLTPVFTFSSDDVNLSMRDVKRQTNQFGDASVPSRAASDSQIADGHRFHRANPVASILWLGFGFHPQQRLVHVQI